MDRPSGVAKGFLLWGARRVAMERPRGQGGRAADGEGGEALGTGRPFLWAWPGLWVTPLPTPPTRPSPPSERGSGISKGGIFQDRVRDFRGAQSPRDRDSALRGGIPDVTAPAWRWESPEAGDHLGGPFWLHVGHLRFQRPSWVSVGSRFPGARGAIALARLLPGLAATLVVRLSSILLWGAFEFVLPSAMQKGGLPPFPSPSP